MYHPPQILKLAPAMYKQYNLKHCNFIGTGNHIVYSYLNDPGHGDRNWQMNHDISWNLENTAYNYIYKWKPKNDKVFNVEIRCNIRI